MAKVATGTVYIYFKNKTALVEALYLQTKHEFASNVLRANGDLPVRAAFQRMCVAFLDYLTGTDAQTIFGNRGYRPVVPDVAATFDTFPTPANLFTIADLGGWADVTKTFFDKTDGSITKILAGLGAQP